MAKPWRACQNLKINWTGITEGTDPSYSSDRVNYIWSGCYTQYCIQYCIVPIMWQIIYLWEQVRKSGVQKSDTCDGSSSRTRCTGAPAWRIPRSNCHSGRTKLASWNWYSWNNVTLLLSLLSGPSGLAFFVVPYQPSIVQAQSIWVRANIHLIHKLAEIATYLFLIFCTDFFNWWMHALIRLCLWH